MFLFFLFRYGPSGVTEGLPESGPSSNSGPFAFRCQRSKSIKHVSKMTENGCIFSLAFLTAFSNQRLVPNLVIVALLQNGSCRGAGFFLRPVPPGDVWGGGSLGSGGTPRLFWVRPKTGIFFENAWVGVSWTPPSLGLKNKLSWGGARSYRMRGGYLRAS